MSSQPALVTPEVTVGCEWVLAGEGVATRKYDGMCCAVIDGVLWKRREVKLGKPIPDGFVQTDEDSVTGKKFGWLLCGTGPDDKYFRAVVASRPVFEEGTHELLGPKIQGNPEALDGLFLMKHSKAQVLHNVTRTFDGLKICLGEHDIEGIVFHHEDGRMAKIKGKDFGIKRTTA